MEFTRKSLRNNELRVLQGRLLGAAGVSSADGGSYRLRHTFALRQLRRGTSPDQVARWLGMADAGALWRYRRVLDEPADVI